MRFPRSCRPASRPGAAFTIVEVLVVVSIITLLIAMIQPSLGHSRMVTRRAICASNLRQMNIANANYIDSNVGIFPPHRDPAINTGKDWFNLLEKYGNTAELSRCPAIAGVQTDFNINWSWAYNANYIGYGYNGFFLGLYSHPDASSYGTYIQGSRWFKAIHVKDPSKLIVHGDHHPKTDGTNDFGVSCSLWWPYINAFKEGINGNRHHGAGVVGFADQHAAVVMDPQTNLHPPFDNSPINIEYWDPKQRRP